MLLVILYTFTLTSMNLPGFWYILMSWWVQRHKIAARRELKVWTAWCGILWWSSHTLTTPFSSRWLQLAFMCWTPRRLGHATVEGFLLNPWHRYKLFEDEFQSLFFGSFFWDGFDFNSMFLCLLDQIFWFENWKITKHRIPSDGPADCLFIWWFQGAAVSLGMDCSIRLHATGRLGKGNGDICIYVYIYIYTYFFQDGLEFRRCEAVPVFFSESMEKLLLLETQQFTIFIYLQYETTKGVILTTAEK